MQDNKISGVKEREACAKTFEKRDPFLLKNNLIKFNVPKWMVWDHQTCLCFSIFLLDWATAKSQHTFVSQDCFWQTTAKDKFMAQSLRFKICDKTLCWIKIWISSSTSTRCLPLLIDPGADIVNPCF